MKYLSTFTGIGGFELGIQKAYELINLQSNNNCDNIDICKNNAQNVKKQKIYQSSIIQEQTQGDVKNVPEKKLMIDIKETQKNIKGQFQGGKKETQKNINRLQENKTKKGEKESLICTEENVPVVESQKKNFSHLNINDKMDIKTEKNTEQDICINSHSKKIINQNTKFCATTATMQEEDMGNVPICVGFSEINKYATKIYEKHFPTHTNFGDITTINAKELPDFDLLVGGVPCQSWSIAGKRGGFEDERGNMWFQYSRILRAKQPKYFLAENVKGLLSHDGGKSMERICEELCGCGYAIDFEVLNAKNFGVPQNRMRVFIIGVRLDLLDECQVF